MNYTIHITKKAEADIESAADYIEHTLLNPKAADSLLAFAERKINALSCMPQSHQLVDDAVLKALGIRYLLIKNYIAFYTIDEVSKYTSKQWRRISIKPGITGMWQVNGRSAVTDFNRVVELDTDYIDNWSLFLDIKIILMTITHVLARKNSY